MQEKKGVLIFDDDEDLLSIFSFLFEDDGWQVQAFHSCDDVIALSKQFSPDLILMDNWIPTLGGMAATQLLKANDLLSRIPVIYISANNDVQELSKKAGADAFMAKPFDFDELIKLARSLVNKND